MAAQGQTIFAASGDAGSADCDTDPTGGTSSALAVDDPASQPYVTGVGGTNLQSTQRARVDVEPKHGARLAECRWRWHLFTVANANVADSARRDQRQQRHSVRRDQWRLPRGARRQCVCRTQHRLPDLFRRQLGHVWRHQRGGTNVGSTDRAGRLEQRVHRTQVGFPQPGALPAARRWLVGLPRRHRRQQRRGRNERRQVCSRDRVRHGHRPRDPGGRQPGE